MTSRHLIAFLLTSLLAPTAAFAEAKCPNNIETVRYHLTRSGRIEVPVRIVDSGPYNFILDTGQQLTIIEPSLAVALHLSPESSVPVISGVKMDKTDLVKVGSIEVGSHTVRDPLVGVISLAQMQESEPEIRGVLGENFLMRFDLFLHLGHKILCLDESSRMRQEFRGEHIPIIESTDFPGTPEIPRPILVPVRLAEFGSRTIVLRLDSGTTAPILFRHPLVVNPYSLTHRVRAQVPGNTQQIFTILPPQDLFIGKHLLHNIAFATPLDITGNPIFAGEDGLLPAMLFERVYISYARRFAVLDPI